MQAACRNLLSVLRKGNAVAVQNLARRNYGSPGKELVQVDFDDKKRVGKLTMQRAPVNSLNFNLIESLSTALESLETRKCRGVILTSSLPVFSAGLDITEMMTTQEDRLRAFWMALQGLWMRLFLSPMATVALVNGHSPAGGCLLAMSCDYRIMVGEKSTIGLNETQLGIIAPFWFRDTMLQILSPRQTDLSLQLGLLYTGKQAIKNNLVDKLVDSREAGEAAAAEQLQLFGKISDTARKRSKALMRQEIVDKLIANRDHDIDYFVQSITQPKIQASLKTYVESLKKK